MNNEAKNILKTDIGPDAAAEQRMLSRLLSESERLGYIKNEETSESIVKMTQEQPLAVMPTKKEKVNKMDANKTNIKKKPRYASDTRFTAIKAAGMALAVVALAAAVIALSISGQQNGAWLAGGEDAQGENASELYPIEGITEEVYYEQQEAGDSSEAQATDSDAMTDLADTSQETADTDLASGDMRSDLPSTDSDAPSAASDVTLEESGAQVVIAEDGTREVTVSTARQLLLAIGSDTCIYVEPGVYDLTAEYPGFEGNSSVYFSEVFDGMEVMLDGVSNLTIQGLGETPPELLAVPRYADVLAFQNCSGITIINVEAGHTRGDGDCAGSVFSFTDSTEIAFDNTYMYGCGAYGLELSGVTDMLVTNSTIYECNYGIMIIQNSSRIKFVNCVFKDSEKFNMVDLYRSTDIVFDSCEFLRNTTKGTEFEDMGHFINAKDYYGTSERIYFRDTLFSGNYAATGLADTEEVKFDVSCRFENNSFGAPPTEALPDSIFVG